MKNRIELIDLFEKNRVFNRGIEIGSYKGEYAKEILNKWNGKLYLLDLWRSVDDGSYIDETNCKNYNDIMNTCCENIRTFENRCFMLRANADDLCNLFPNEYFDFIYIDANHKYDAVLNDMNKWFPKLRKGGVFAGHDYLKINWLEDPNFSEDRINKHIFSSGGDYMGLFGVNPAVEEFCSINKYNFLTTEQEWFSSWYFIK